MDENAAEHLEAAGNLPDAFAWHMRAGGWLTFRDVNAAASQLAAGPPGRRPPARRRHEPRSDAHRPRALLCASAFRVGGAVDEDGFEELRRLTGAADDKLSLALAMAGHVMSLVFRARYRESSQLATELTGLVDSFSDAGLAVGLLSEVMCAKIANGAIVETLQLAQRAIELAGGDAHLGEFVIESPLTVATMFRAIAQMCLGGSGGQSNMAERPRCAANTFPSGKRSCSSGDTATLFRRARSEPTPPPYRRLPKYSNSPSKRATMSARIGPFPARLRAGEARRTGSRPRTGSPRSGTRGRHSGFVPGGDRADGRHRVRQGDSEDR